MVLGQNKQNSETIDLEIGRHKYVNLLCVRVALKIGLEKINYSIYDVKASEELCRKKSGILPYPLG